MSTLTKKLENLRLQGKGTEQRLAHHLLEK